VNSSYPFLLPSTLGIVTVAFAVIWRLWHVRSALFWAVAFVLWTACEILPLLDRQPRGQMAVAFAHILFLLSIFFQMHGLQEYAGEAKLALRIRIALCVLAIALVGWLDFTRGPAWAGFSVRLIMRLVLTGIALAALRRNLTHAADKILLLVLLVLTGIVTVFAVTFISADISGAHYELLNYSRVVSNVISIIFSMTAMAAILYGVIHRYRDEALKDALSGLSNRRHFDLFRGTEWQRAVDQQRPLSMLVVDVDFFKSYNDNYGHAAGDRCLAQVADIIRASVRQNCDYCARIGGEEFAVLLPNTMAPGAAIVAQNICDAVRAAAIPHGSSQFGVVTVSVGVATAMPVGSDDGMLFEAADRNLYKAKAMGRDRIENGRTDHSAAIPSSITA